MVSRAIGADAAFRKACEQLLVMSDLQLEKGRIY
jgi:hypothetical protein